MKRSLGERPCCSVGAAAMKPAATFGEGPPWPELGYVDREGRRTRRRIEPHGLLVRAPLWYIVGWDLEKDAARLFRVDRIRRPILDEATFEPRPIELVTRVCPDARPARGRERRRLGSTSAQIIGPPEIPPSIAHGPRPGG